MDDKLSGIRIPHLKSAIMGAESHYFAAIRRESDLGIIRADADGGEEGFTHTHIPNLDCHIMSK
jgi:hypothetical protein